MLKFKNVTKKHPNGTVFEDLSFEIAENGVYAVIGPRGSGTGTLLAVSAACLPPESGEVIISGTDIYAHPANAKRKIGYFPREDCFLNEMNVLEFLLFIGDAKRVSREKLYRKIDEIVEIAGLEDVSGKLVRNLDIIAKKRLGIAMTILGNPDLIIYDSIFDGIPKNRVSEFKTLIKMFGEMRPVLLSLSYPSDVLEICNGVIMLPGGDFILREETDGFENYVREKFLAIEECDDKDTESEADNDDEKTLEDKISGIFKKSKGAGK